ncbi:MAG: hypothetical protein ACLQT6_01885 [Desulfomonilaceae bacterium]
MFDLDLIGKNCGSVPFNYTWRFSPTYSAWPLHYGYAARAILFAACDGDVTRIKEFKARFSGVVYPGDTLVTEGWEDKCGGYLIHSHTHRS